MTEGEQVKQLTTKILELWWPGEDPTTFDAPEDAELSEVTLVGLKAYATITAGYILQREASLLKVAEAAHDMLRDYRSIGEQTQGYRTIEVFGRPLAKLQVALDAWQKGRTP